MNDSLPHGVIGTDGKVPIFEPYAPWKIFSLSEIYLGTSGLNKYVPKPLDYVNDPPTFTVYIVESLDPVTFIPTLREIQQSNSSFVLGRPDVLFGVGVGTQAQQMRAYINKGVIPYSLQVDQMLRVGGTKTSYAKIFRGSEINGQGEVISKVYDAAGNFISENVPLEMVFLDNHTTYSEKTVAECKCTANLTDNELLTIVFYSSTGIMVSKAQILVEVTDYVRPLNASSRYVTHIDLESPFMSEGNPNQIDFPLHLPKNSANLEGVVYYSDGSVDRAAVNGTRFSLLGFDQLLSTVEDQVLPLTLRYTLAPGEPSYAPNTIQGKWVAKPYSLRVTNPNFSYSVKLHPFPFWNPIANGYDLRWWMTTLDRSFAQDVTQYVTIDSNMGAWDPYKFGSRQRKQASLNLRDVSAAFKPFVHTQMFEVSLFGRPELKGTAWTVCNEAQVNHVDYGAGLFAKRVSVTGITLKSDLLITDEWVDKFYKATYPLVNSIEELAAPAVSHFAVTYGGARKVFELSYWDKELDLGVSIIQYENLTIEFLRRTSSGDLTLSVGQVIIYT